MPKIIKVKDVSPVTIVKFARAYLANYYCTFETLSSATGYTPRMISNILYRGIAEDILSDSVADQIFYKVVHTYSQGEQQRRNRWEAAFELREEVRSEKKKKRREQIEALENQEAYYVSVIDSYDAYFIEEEDAPPKEKLKERLSFIRNELAILKH